MYRPDYIKNTTSLMPSWVNEIYVTKKNEITDNIISKTLKMLFIYCSLSFIIVLSFGKQKFFELFH